MQDRDRSVFISYRRKTAWAQADLIRIGLTNRGFTVFVDRDDLASGDFEQKILTEIAASAHFVVVLAPGSLTGIERPGDWLHREIARALATGRNIVPVWTDGFQLSTPLPPDIDRLRSLNAISLSSEYPDAALDRLGEWLRPARPRRWLQVALALAVLVVAGAAGIIWFLNAQQGGGDPATTSTGQPPEPGTPSSTTQAPVAGGSTTVPTPADVLFADDFSGAELDPAKWDPGNRPDVIRPVDGHLLMSVRPGDGVEEARLLPTTLSRPFDDVRFTVTIPAYERGGQGGGAFIINPDGEQPQQLTFGPSPSGASVYPLTCDSSRCRLGVYEDFVEAENTNAVRVTYDEPIEIQIVRRDGRLQFSANGTPIGASTVDPGPLTGFRFTASAGSAESWDVEIDDLVIR